MSGPRRWSRASLRWGDVAILAFLSLGALYVTVRTGSVPQQGESGIAVVFAPWTAPEAALARTVTAGARFVRFGGFGFVTIAVPDNRNYRARVLAAGAWLVLDPRVVAACLPRVGKPAANP